MHQLFKKAFSTNNCQFEHKPYPKRPSSKNSTFNNPIELSHTNPPPTVLKHKKRPLSAFLTRRSCTRIRLWIGNATRRALKAIKRLESAIEVNALLKSGNVAIPLCSNYINLIFFFFEFS